MRGRSGTFVLLGAIALALGLSAVAPAFAWTSSLSTTIQCNGSACSNPSAIRAGTAIADKATVTLSNSGKSSGSYPYGKVSFYIYSGTTTGGVTTTNGTCTKNEEAATLYWTDPENVYTVTGTSTTYYTSSSPSSLAPGSYFFYVVYSGTSGGYPGAVSCEPFKVVTSVPQFPLGMALLFAIAIPGLLLVRSRYTRKYSSTPV